MKKQASTLTLRIPHELKHKIEKAADKQGVSINQLALYVFTKELKEFETTEYFSKFWEHRSKSEIFKDFDMVMSRVADGDAPDWDKL